MLIDMHAHTSGISHCCQTDGAGMLEAAARAGIDGVILTNHYPAFYVQQDGPEGLARRFADEYYRTKTLADARGMRLFFGIEVTARHYADAHILLYGPPPEALLQHPCVYDYTLEEMQQLVQPYGGLVIQAHPFRHGGHVIDHPAIDGLEINCHPLYDDTHSDRLMDIAREKEWIITCGGDYHADTYRAVCGVHFPDDISDITSLTKYLRTAPVITMHIHELRTEDHRDRQFIRP